MRGSDQHTFARLLLLQASGKRLHDRSPDGSIPALRLKIDILQTQLIFFDNPVDPSVTAPAHPLASILMRATIAHCDKQIDNHALEEDRGFLLDPLKQRIRQLAPQDLIACIQHLARRLLRYLRNIATFQLFLLWVLAKIGQLGVLLKVAQINALLIRTQLAHPPLSDPDSPPPCALDQLRLAQVRRSPPDPIDKLRLLTA